MLRGSLLLSKDEIKDLLQLTEPELEEMVRRGFPGLFVSDQMRFPLIDVVRWLSRAATRSADEIRRRGYRFEPAHEAMVAAHEITRMLGIRRRTVDTYVKKGMPHTRTPGGHLRFEPQKVRAWFDNHHKPPEERVTTGLEIALATRRGREAARKFKEWEAKRAAKIAAKKAAASKLLR